MKLKKIDDVVKSGMCAGCGACSRVSDKVVMEVSGRGFYRPRLEEALDQRENKIFGTVCPGISIIKPNTQTEDSLFWGAVLECCDVQATDSDILQNSSSGGGVTALANHLLGLGFIDGVIHTCPAENNIDTVTVVSRCKEDLMKAMGSRYCPSSPLNNIKNIIEENKRYIFIGKPCDVVALRSLMAVYDDLKESITLLVSFFCAGVPSQNATKELVRKMGVDENNLVKLRYRGDGWPGYAIASDLSGNTGKLSYQDSWGKVLNKDLQSRCRICIDGIGEGADIVFGDAWETDSKGYPTFNERVGRSLALARTDVGVRMLASCVDSGSLKRFERDINTLDKLQNYQLERRGSVASRKLAFFILGMPTTSYIRYPLIKLLMSIGLRKNIKYFVGTLKRLILNRRNLVS